MDRVISLARTPDRLERFRTLNAHVDAQWVPAVDGQCYGRIEAERNGLISPGLAYTPGAIGCLASHAEFWRFTDAGKHICTIFEDDAVIHAEFYALRERVLGSLPPDWDICLWGFNLNAGVVFDVIPGVTPCAAYFYPAKARQGLAGFPRSEIRPQPYRLRRHMGTVAYTLSPTGARRLLAEALPTHPFTLTIPAGRQWPNTGVDMVLNALYDRLNAYVTFPPVVITPNDDKSSTIFQTK